MIEPAQYRFKVWKGATFRKTIHFLDENDDPKDLSNYTGVLAIRDEPDSESNLLELTSEDGGITFGGTNGTIELFIDESVTGTITWSAAYYDLKITSPAGPQSDTDVILYGSFSVHS